MQKSSGECNTRPGKGFISPTCSHETRTVLCSYKGCFNDQIKRRYLLLNRRSHFQSIPHYLYRGRSCEDNRRGERLRCCCCCPSCWLTLPVKCKSLDICILGIWFSPSVSASKTDWTLSSISNPKQWPTSIPCVWHYIPSRATQYKTWLLPSVVHLGYSCHWHVRAVNEKNENSQQT